MQTPAKRSGRRFLIGGVIGTVALLLTTAAIVNTQANTAWQAMHAKGEELRANCAAAMTTREPLWGEATNDLAFDHYELAAKRIKPLSTLRNTLRALPVDEFLEGIAEHRAAWLPALDELRAGSHARNMQTDLHGTTPRMRNLLAYRDVVNSAILEARALRISGDDIGSVRWILDAATLGVDCIHDGILINQMTGLALVAIVAEECEDAMLASLSPSALEQLADGLAIVDERMPKQLPIDRELVSMRDHLDLVPDEAEWCPDSSWRFGFSLRWMLADWFLAVAAAQERIASASDKSWPERQLLIQRESEAALASTNTVMSTFYPNTMSAELNLREVVAMVRMLRMAVAMHRDVELEPLQDPLGEGQLIVLQQNDAIMLRTVARGDRDPRERLVRLKQ